MACELAGFGNHVIGIDADEKLVAPLAGTLAETVIADVRDEQALREAGVAGCDAAVVAIGSNLEACILAHLNLQRMGMTEITVKAFDERHAMILRELGAADVLIPEADAGEHIAQRLHNPLIRDYMPIQDGAYAALVKAPPGLVGRRFRDIQFQDGFGIECLGVMRGGTFLRPDDPADLYLADIDLLLVQGTRKAIRAFTDARS